MLVQHSGGAQPLEAALLIRCVLKEGGRGMKEKNREERGWIKWREAVGEYLT